MQTIKERRLSYSDRLRLAFVCLVAALVMLACQACNLQPAPHGPTMSTSPGASVADTKAATFQIHATVVFAGSDADAGSDEEEPKSESWTGTGWIGAHDPSTTYVVTAGHVCETRKIITITPDPLEQLLGAEVQTFKVDHVVYELRSADDDIYPVERVLVDDDHTDVCVLKIGSDLGAPLPIAWQSPEYGAAGWYVGAPDAIWGGGLAGLFPATYSGKGHPWRGACDSDPDTKPLCDNDAEMFTVAATHGASGSAVLVNGRVVGLINLVDDGFTNVSATVPWYELRSALIRARNVDLAE